MGVYWGGAEMGGSSGTMKSTILKCNYIYVIQKYNFFKYPL